jgi:hypothetical protein
MSTLADWNLRGPVHTLRFEQTTWDADAQAWKPARHVTTAVFRPDGQTVEVVAHNPNGSTSHRACDYDDSGRLAETRSWMNDDAPTRVMYDYDADGRVVLAVQITPDGLRSEIERSTYDAAGRRTKVAVLPSLPTAAGEVSMSYGVEGSTTSFGAPGATTLVTNYDERGLPAAATFHDAAGRVVLRVTFTRDDAGRVLTEEARIGGPLFLANLPSDQDLPAEARVQLEAFAGVAFPDGVYHSAVHTYDAAGRLIERITRFGAMAEQRTTFQYGDHGDPVEEMSSGRSQSMDSGEGGGVAQGHFEVDENATRYEYKHDAGGNWTERLTFHRSGADGSFNRGLIERRVISYHDH